MTRRFLLIILSVLLTIPSVAQVFVAHPWQGKRVAYFGDSITDPRNAASKDKYWSLLQQWLGITPYVYGVSGRQWNDIARQANKLKTEHGDDFDAIMIFIGTNDYNKGIPLGEWYEEKKEMVEAAIGEPKKMVERMRRYPVMDENTYRGRINIAMDTLKRMFPTKQIVVLTPIHRSGFYRSETNWQPSEDYQNRNGEYLSAYIEATKEIANVWAVPVVDLNAMSGLYPLLDVHAQYFKDKDVDRLHPNDAGHLRMAKTLMYQLLTLPCTFDAYKPEMKKAKGKGEGKNDGMQPRPGRYSLRGLKTKFFLTEDAKRIGDQVIAYQRVTGGWPKNIDMAQQLSEEGLAKVLKDKERRDDSTIDNNATTMQMTYLARLYKATKVEKYREAFMRGLDFLLSGQYDNGGWPQFWPDPKGYQVHITYNDGAISNTLSLFADMANGITPYNCDIIDDATKERVRTALDKAVDCILKTQIVVNGEPTVWCQQHDRETFAPAKARAYELPSYCSQESAALVKLLMDLPTPDERIKKAVHGAMKWFDKYKITHLRFNRANFRGSVGETRLIPDQNAAPLWARFYDLKNCEPYVCDRDGIPHKALSEIGEERRNNYAWYDERPAEVFPIYDKWAEKYDPKNKVSVSLTTPGANENGTIKDFEKNYLK